MNVKTLGALLVLASATWVLDAHASDCKPGTLNASGTCDCPPGFSSHGSPGKSTCMKSNVAPLPATTAATTPAKPKVKFSIACPTGTVPVAGGSYTNKRGKLVEVADFCMDKTEVTVASYGTCVDGSSCTAPATYDTAATWSFQSACNWKHPDGRAKHPVNCLTVGQARDYCAFKKARLPTEWEWEWAARGKAKENKFPWGAAAPEKKHANVCGSECLGNASKKWGSKWTTKLEYDDGFPETAPVGSFSAGAVDGVLDLSGNVAELTMSWFDVYGAKVVARGGAWTDGTADDFSSYLREKFDATDRSPHVGFRCIVSNDVKTMPTPAKKAPALGSRVARGPDWKWGDQGGGKGGTVIREANEDGWVQIRWDNEEENDYRWGADDKYDLKEAKGFLPQLCDKSAKVGSAEMGAMVILTKHRAVTDDDNWATKMSDYVGKQAVVTKVNMYDNAGCAVVRVNIDGGAFVWRVRDLGLP